MATRDATPLIKNAARHLRQLRHPRLLKYEWEQKTASLISIVTEPVEPLAPLLQSLDGSEALMIVHDVAEALLFLDQVESLPPSR